MGLNLNLKKGKCLLWAVCLLVLILILPQQAMAAEEIAKEISSRSLVSDSVGFEDPWYLFDGNRRTGYLTAAKATLTLSYNKGIGSVYMTFNTSYPSYTVVNLETGEKKTIENGYVHAFLDMNSLFGSAPKKVQLRFEKGQAALYEMRVFTAGKVPDSIQNWSEPADGKTDLVLFSAHCDDDQIFFAGLLPYYAVERGYRVQVVFLTDHSNTYNLRMHEALDALWSVGIRSYPVFAPYPDFYYANTVEDAFSVFETYGHTQDDMTAFVVEQLRRFKPMVAVGHDPNGEYGHVQHKVFSKLLADAVAVSGDKNAYPESAAAYGEWDVPKTYLHLYEQNEIVMDWDIPMENFGGKTPYEVSRDLGFMCYGSQYESWIGFFEGNKASSLIWYSPCYYGLYRTTVGVDQEKNDMFENVISHAEQDILAQEEAARQEEERKRQEEEAKAIQESIAEDEKRRKSAEQTLANQSKLEPLANAAWILGGAILLVILVVALVNHLRAPMIYREEDFQVEDREEDSQGEE